MVDETNENFSDEPEVQEFVDEATDQPKDDKENKWFAVEIKYAAPTKSALKKLLKENVDMRKCPTIIRGNLKPTSVEKNPTLVF